MMVVPPVVPGSVDAVHMCIDTATVESRHSSGEMCAAFPVTAALLQRLQLACCWQGYAICQTT
jgi:hypothetical protein